MENKKVKNATPLTYDGIKFRSKLEVFCYQKLKESKIPFEYEAHTYEIFPKYKYEGYEYPEKLTSKGNVMRGVMSITYTPDFVIRENIIIECKGWKDSKFPLKWKMFKKLLQDRFSDKVYLYMPRNQKQVTECVELIKNLLKNAKK